MYQEVAGSLTDNKAEMHKKYLLHVLYFVLDCLSSYFKPHYNWKITLHNSMHCKN